MKRFSALALSAAALAGGAKAADNPCRSERTTQAIAQCLIAAVGAADRKLADYLMAAQQRSIREQTRPTQLGNGQDAWELYRKIHCGQVYEFHVEGTVRYQMAGLCQLSLTRERTHEIWSEYLTYPDSTPPVLPEP